MGWAYGETHRHAVPLGDHIPDVMPDFREGALLGDGTDLLHHAQSVVIEPALHHLALAGMEDGHDRDSDSSDHHSNCQTSATGPQPPTGIAAAWTFS